MVLEHLNMTIKSTECPTGSWNKWYPLWKWDIIQISESNSMFKIINGHSRGCLIIDGKVPKLAACEEESNTWILNQATMTTTITTATTTTTTTKTSIGKFSLIN